MVSPAWARLSVARSLQLSWGWDEGISSDSLLALSGAAAARALALDSTLAESWLADGTWAMQRLDAERAIASWNRALRLDSLNPDVYHQIGALYGPEYMGVLDAAEPALRRALALDPDLRNTWRHLAAVLRMQGRLPEAEALLDTAIALGPWAPGLAERAYVRFLRGNGAGALADAADAQRAQASDTIAIPLQGDLPRLRALVPVALGDSAAARAELSRLRAAPDSSQDVQIARAELAMALGLRDDALVALERLRSLPGPREFRCGPALCSASLNTWIVVRDPIFRSLRGEPRYQRLLAETRPHIPWLAAWR